MISCKNCVYLKSLCGREIYGMGWSARGYYSTVCTNVLNIKEWQYINSYRKIYRDRSIPGGEDLKILGMFLPIKKRNFMSFKCSNFKKGKNKAIPGISKIKYVDDGNKESKETYCY